MRSFACFVQRLASSFIPLALPELPIVERRRQREAQHVKTLWFPVGFDPLLRYSLGAAVASFMTAQSELTDVCFRGLVNDFGTSFDEIRIAWRNSQAPLAFKCR